MKLLTEDRGLSLLLGLIFSVLIVGTAITMMIVVRQKRTEGNVSPTVENLASRVRAWWVMVAIMVATVLVNPLLLFVLYGILSALALREFLSVTPTLPADYRALALAFLVIPIHYCIAATGWYVLFLIFVPVYVFTAVPIVIALQGETERFLERTAKIQWGILVAVHFVSYMPMLLHIDAGLADPRLGDSGLTAGAGVRLTLFLVIVAQLSDVFQYVFGKLFGRTQLAPTVSPNKTLEGLLLGGAAAVTVGTALHQVTPFGLLGTAALSTLVVAAGFFGGLVMSAVKRSLGAKDWGSSIGGHGGMFDRLDSLAFAAPTYFHVLVYYSGIEMQDTHPAWLDSIFWLGSH